jgi:ketopantoate reductase
VRAPDHRISALQDLEAGRPLEIEETLGHATRLARELELSLPLLDAFYHLVAGIDHARRGAHGKQSGA